MAYPVYYPTGCDAEIGNHYCNDCEPAEGGRIRSVAFIADDFEFIDPTSASEWQAGILAKKILIIPKTNGTFDGGSEVEAPGYGDQSTMLTGYNFTLTYNDPNYKYNADFYNSLKRSIGYRLAFRTQRLIHLTDSTVSVVPKNPVQDDPATRVVWAVTAKWQDSNLPVPYDAPAGIFECYDYTGAVT